MKLTVGPMPSAVYWRRRLVVLGALLLLIIVTWASCSGSGKDRTPAARKDAVSGASASTTSPAPVGSPSPSAASSQPAAPAETGTGTPTNPSPAAASTPQGPAMCTDAEISVVPAAQSPTAPRGQPQTLYLRVKNITGRACPRDLGSGAQELYLQLGSNKVWSSDECAPGRVSKVQVENLAPNIEHESHLQWSGNLNKPGCGSQSAPAAGRYQLYGRLGTKISEPVTVTLT